MWLIRLLPVSVLLNVPTASDGFHVSATALRDRRVDRGLPSSPQMSAKQQSLRETAPVTRSRALQRRCSARLHITASLLFFPISCSKALGAIGVGVGVASTLLAKPGVSGALESDEFQEVFTDAAIGLELADVKYKGSSRVLVKRIVPGSAAASRPRIKADFVLVSANGIDLERQNAAAAKKIIMTSPRPLALVLRDTSIFQQLLKPEQEASSAAATAAAAPESAEIAAKDGGFEPITTRVSPAGAGREEQVLKVLRSDKSPGCEFCGSGARKGDLLEIEYTAKLEDGKVFDGSSIKVNGQEVVGRAGDKTLFFVLGKQPKGQFPPGWDLLLVGMCVGESRLISVPPLLGYGSQGMPRRGVPPDATLLYDVKLVGVNAINMCVA